MATNWIQLAALPMPYPDQEPKQINDVAFFTTYYSKQQNHLEIHQYDEIFDKWTKDPYIVSTDWKWGAFGVTFDKATKSFYIYVQGKLYKFNPKSNSSKLVLQDIPLYDQQVRMLCIDGKIIVMAEGTNGITIDTKYDMKITEISRSGNFRYSSDYILPLITTKYIKSQNYILNLVFHLNGDKYVQKCLFSDDTLIETGLKFASDPHLPMEYSGYALSKNEKYLITFGGKGEWDDR